MQELEITSLKELREKLGITLSGVADALGVHTSHINKLEGEDINPGRPIVGQVFDFYHGVVPVSAIYWPTHESSVKFFKSMKQRQFSSLRSKLIKSNPDSFKKSVRAEFNF